MIEKPSFRPHAGSAGEEERDVSSNNICVIRSARPKDGKQGLGANGEGTKGISHTERDQFH